jgi:hypothetical protein
VNLAETSFLTLLAGRTLPVPLPLELTQRVRSVTVTETDDKRAVFSIVFDAGRSGVAGALDNPFGLTSPVAPFSRVVLMLTFGGLPAVLFDGIVTETRHDTGGGAGDSTVTVTGDDVSNLLDREQRDVAHPALSDHLQVLAILAPYAAKGLIPEALPPPTSIPPLPIDRIPTQHGTDLQHLIDLAGRNGFVTYLKPGPAPGVSRVYWGPPARAGVPQPALAVDLGTDTNVTEVSFRTEATTPRTVSGAVLDRQTGATTPVKAPVPLRPPLGAVPFAAANAGDLQQRRLRDTGSDSIAAQVRAQAEVDRSSDAVIAEGRADGARYGAVLRPRALVGMRGAGVTHDGLWYVRRVEHQLAPGSYAFGFTLARDGHGATTPVLPRAAA